MKILKPITFSVLLASSIVSATSLAATLTTQRSIFPENGGLISPQLTFEQSETGDLYLATMIDGKLYFILNDGTLSETPAPFLSNQSYQGGIDLPQFDTTGIAAGQYPLYQVITFPGTDVLNFSNWVGGIGSLNVINFSVGLPTEISKDFDDDGWSDDDLDHDGYHDDDHNKDGYHDDDHDKDGYHDDDDDKDGHHDDESDDSSDENHSDDSSDNENDENHSDDSSDDESDENHSEDSSDDESDENHSDDSSDDENDENHSDDSPDDENEQ